VSALLQLFFKRQPGIGFPQPVVCRLQQRLSILVMLILDIAD
jgi:hypothetical protein